MTDLFRYVEHGFAIPARVDSIDVSNESDFQGELADAADGKDAQIRIPLPMLNRHGLVAGATGTGKTKTLQGIAEQLSAKGVPVFLADMKGDLSGLAQAGATIPPWTDAAATSSSQNSAGGVSG